MSVKEENMMAFKKELEEKLKAYHYAYIPTLWDRLKGKSEKHWILIPERWGKWGGSTGLTKPWKIPCQPLSVACCTEEDAWEDAWVHYKTDPNYYEEMAGTKEVWQDGRGGE